MEESAIREGFANLRPGSEYEKGYMQYIADHDNYRCADPLFKSQKRMFGKTKKERRRLKKRERKIKRWQGIRYVNRLFDMVASGVAVL